MCYRLFLRGFAEDKACTATGDESFVSVFNGTDLTGWVGDTKGYVVENGEMVCKPGGNIFVEKEYSDFVFRFEFKLTPGAIMALPSGRP